MNIIISHSPLMEGATYLSLSHPEQCGSHWCSEPTSSSGLDTTPSVGGQSRRRRWNLPYSWTLKALRSVEVCSERPLTNTVRPPRREEYQKLSCRWHPISIVRLSSHLEELTHAIHYSGAMWRLRRRERYYRKKALLVVSTQPVSVQRMAQVSAGGAL